MSQVQQQPLSPAMFQTVPQSGPVELDLDLLAFVCGQGPTGGWCDSGPTGGWTDGPTGGWAQR